MDYTKELFFKELRSSRSAALVLSGDCSLPDASCGYHTADTNMSKSFLKHLDYKVLRELIRKGALLDRLLANNEHLVGEVAIGVCLGHCDHESHRITQEFYVILCE